MLIYYKILQIHAKTESIIIPTCTKKDINMIMDRRSQQLTPINSPSTGASYIGSEDNIFGSLEESPKKSMIDSVFWNKIYNDMKDSTNECSGGLLKENGNNTVIFQIYFLISCLYTFEINEKKLVQRIHHKYSVAYKTIINNMFMLSSQKTEIEEIFYKSQRTYLSLRKFLHIYLFKRAEIKINTDLCLNTIDPTKQNVFIIVQNKAKYMFTTTDILNLTMTSLKTNQSFFSEPHKPRNPYTNIPFTTADMYNIYFHISNSRFITPPLLTECFLNNFDMERFLINNETKLRDFSIKNHILNSPNSTLYNEVMYMIHHYFRDEQKVEYSVKSNDSKRKKKIISRWINVKLEINPEFPRDVLIETMRPYLYLYTISKNYIIGTEKQNIANKIFKYRIKIFMRYNSKFGRKILTINQDTIHNPFTQCENTNKYKIVKPKFNSNHETFTVFQAEEMLSTKYLIQYSRNMPQIAIINNNSENDSNYYDTEDDDSEENDNSEENENILQEEFIENFNELNHIDQIIRLPYSSDGESTGYDSL